MEQSLFCTAEFQTIDEVDDLMHHASTPHGSGDPARSVPGLAEAVDFERYDLP
jgi:hypothetical protein